jgi:hypothetical protein
MKFSNTLWRKIVLPPFDSLHKEPNPVLCIAQKKQFDCNEKSNIIIQPDFVL